MSYLAIVEFLTDGYGPNLATVLMIYIVRYLYATNALNMCLDEWDVDTCDTYACR